MARQLPKVERNRNIVAERESGMTYREIADRYGISMERVRQIIGDQPGVENRLLQQDRQQQDRDRRDHENPIIRSLSTRARGALVIAGIRDDPSLLMASDAYLRSTRGLGKKTLAEINEKRRGA